jgi:hypothetical protein
MGLTGVGGDDVQVDALCALGEIAGKEVEEGLHFCVESLDRQNEEGAS